MERSRLPARAVPGQLPLRLGRRRDCATVSARGRSLPPPACARSWNARSTAPRSTPTGEYPTQVIDGLRELGAFGMKIPKEYGGLGLNQLEYSRAIEICGRYDGNIVALLSAHQSIGVPQPLKLFGTEEQKKRYLPRCAAGAISAFALTETEVGCDPGAARDARRAHARGRLRAERREAVVHERHVRRAARGHGAHARQAHQRVHRRDELARRRGRAPLPLHGPARARERRHRASRTCACRRRT